MRVACTEFLTALHTGGRSAKAIDASGRANGRRNPGQFTVAATS